MISGKEKRQRARKFSGLMMQEGKEKFYKIYQLNILMHMKEINENLNYSLIYDDPDELELHPAKR